MVGEASGTAKDGIATPSPSPEWEAMQMIKKKLKKYSKAALISELACRMTYLGNGIENQHTFAYLEDAEKNAKFNRRMARMDRIDRLMKAGEFKKVNRILIGKRPIRRKRARTKRSSAEGRR